MIVPITYKVYKSRISFTRDGTTQLWEPNLNRVLLPVAQDTGTVIRRSADKHETIVKITSYKVFFEMKRIREGTPGSYEDNDFEIVQEFLENTGVYHTPWTADCSDIPGIRRTLEGYQADNYTLKQHSPFSPFFNAQWTMESFE